MWCKVVCCDLFVACVNGDPHSFSALTLRVSVILTQFQFLPHSVSVSFMARKKLPVLPHPQNKENVHIAPRNPTTNKSPLPGSDDTLIEADSGTKLNSISKGKEKYLLTNVHGQNLRSLLQETQYLHINILLRRIYPPRTCLRTRTMVQTHYSTDSALRPWHLVL